MIIPLPKYTEPEIEVTEDQDYKRIHDYWFNAGSWKCVKCQAVMFGRMDYCIYCKVRLNQDTRRAK